jgi:hypothetical protein
MGEPGRHASEVDLRLALVRHRYGERLSPEQIDDLRRAVEAIVEQVAALGTVRLANSDEPLSRFEPFRADE